MGKSRIGMPKNAAKEVLGYREHLAVACVRAGITSVWSYPAASLTCDSLAKSFDSATWAITHRQKERRTSCKPRKRGAKKSRSSPFGFKECTPKRQISEHHRFRTGITTVTTAMPAPKFRRPILYSGATAGVRRHEAEFPAGTKVLREAASGLRTFPQVP